MSEDNNNSISRRDAMMTMIVGAMAAPSLANAAPPQPAAKKDKGHFKPYIPYKTPVGSKQPMGIQLYGPCNGDLDIIMSDLMPDRNKYGQFLDKDGNVVPADKAKMVPQKNLLLYIRDLPGPEKYSNPKKVKDLESDGEIEIGTDFGGHYHEGTEVIYCPQGKYRVEVRENSGLPIVDYQGDTVVEHAPTAEHGPRYVEVFEAGQAPQKFPLTSQVQSFDVSRGQMMIIPGRAYHSVYMIESGDMMVYLPDGKRFAEEAVSQPDKC